jgi:hypothetical protein
MQTKYADDYIKVCTKCKQELPAYMFDKRYGLSPGLQSWCRTCCNALRLSKYRPHPKPPTVVDGKKCCSACKAWLPVADFSPNVRLRKHQAYCRLCFRARMYGLTRVQWFQIFDSQNGCCATCYKKLDVGGIRTKAPCIDHDHETGKVRGILCDFCNRALGDVKDDIKTLKSLIRYLELHQASAKEDVA